MCGKLWYCGRKYLVMRRVGKLEVRWCLLPIVKRKCADHMRKSEVWSKFKYQPHSIYPECPELAGLSCASRVPWLDRECHSVQGTKKKSWKFEFVWRLVMIEMIDMVSESFPGLFGWLIVVGFPVVSLCSYFWFWFAPCLVLFPRGALVQCHWHVPTRESPGRSQSLNLVAPRWSCVCASRRNSFMTCLSIATCLDNHHNVLRCTTFLSNRLRERVHFQCRDKFGERDFAGAVCVGFVLETGWIAIGRMHPGTMVFFWILCFIQGVGTNFCWAGEDVGLGSPTLKG